MASERAFSEPLDKATGTLSARYSAKKGRGLYATTGEKRSRLCNSVNPNCSTDLLNVKSEYAIGFPFRLLQYGLQYPQQFR